MVDIQEIRRDLKPLNFKQLNLKQFGYDHMIRTAAPSNCPLRNAFRASLACSRG